MKKNWLVFPHDVFNVTYGYAQESSYQLSSHILDISTVNLLPVKIALQKEMHKTIGYW